MKEARVYKSKKQHAFEQLSAGRCGNLYTDMLNRLSQRLNQQHSEHEKLSLYNMQFLAEL